MNSVFQFRQLVVIAAILASLGVTPAFAQGGLFGATRSDVGKRNRLNFTFQMAEGWDSSLPPDVNSRVQRGLDSGGWSTILQGSSDYSRSGRRVQLTGDASTAFKYYQSLDRVEAVSHVAGLGASVRIRNTGSLRLEQTAAYSPSYFYQLFPTSIETELGDVVPASPEFNLEDAESYSYTSGMTLKLGSPRATQLSASGGFNRTDYSGQTLLRDSEVYDGGLELSRRLSSRVSVKGGYNFRSGTFGRGGHTTEHMPTVGVELAHALSRTRRATLRLDVSPSRIEARALELPGLPEPGNHRLNRVSGEAQINLPFRLNWEASANYRRSMEYFTVLNQPVLAKGGRVQIKGLLSRRIDLKVSGAYVDATSAFASSTDPLQTYTGQLSLRYALKRSIAVNAEYLYYYYDLGAQTGFSSSLPTIFEQHGGRIGVMLFLEALGR